MRKRYTEIPLDHPNPASDEKIMRLPVLLVSVGRRHASTPRFHAVVDSGSPYCLFRSDVGRSIGLDIESGKASPMGGVIANLQESAYFHRVQIYVESDWKITVMAGFMENLSVGGILGRNGFFDNFRVTFDQGVNPPEFEIIKIVRPS